MGKVQHARGFGSLVCTSGANQERDLSVFGATVEEQEPLKLGVIVVPEGGRPRTRAHTSNSLTGARGRSVIPPRTQSRDVELVAMSSSSLLPKTKDGMHGVVNGVGHSQESTTLDSEEDEETTTTEQESDHGGGLTLEGTLDRCLGRCGLSKPRQLPMLLIVSTILGAACMAWLQRELFGKLLGSKVVYDTIYLCLYGVTFGLMTYTALRDPGMISNTMLSRWVSGEAELPKRTYNDENCERPILRYDHYCRWINNWIGLYNHREFIVMAMFLSIVACAGVVVDVALLAFFWQATDWWQKACLMVHCAYSLAFAYYVVPIFRQHIGFVSRNELAQEWKSDMFYIIHHAETGEPIAVNMLEDEEEYNAHFDNFQYDGTRNPWDKGCPKNCGVFWCTPRWAEGQLGEF